MSLNLTLHAVALSTIHLKDGDFPRKIEEKIHLWQTPTEITNRVLALPSPEERLQAYKDWALTNDKVIEETVWDPEDPTLQVTLDEDFNHVVTGESVRVVTRTVGEAHIQRLETLLAGFKGWDFEWSYI